MQREGFDDDDDDDNNRLGRANTLVAMAWAYDATRYNRLGCASVLVAMAWAYDATRYNDDDDDDNAKNHRAPQRHLPFR